MQINTLAPNTINGPSTASPSGFDSLKTEDFVAILLAELQNQNPLEPMDNAQLLDQFNSINSLTTSNRLIDTLQAMTLSQSLGSASNMIGKTVRAQIGNSEVEGVVESAVVENGKIFLTVGETRFPIGNVLELKSPNTETN